MKYATQYLGFYRDLQYGSDSVDMWQQFVQSDIPWYTAGPRKGAISTLADTAAAPATPVMMMVTSQPRPG